MFLSESFVLFRFVVLSRASSATFLLLLALPFILFNSHAATSIVWSFYFWLFLYLFLLPFFFIIFSSIIFIIHTHLDGLHTCISVSFGSAKCLTLFPPNIEQAMEKRHWFVPRLIEDDEAKKKNKCLWSISCDRTTIMQGKIQKKIREQQQHNKISIQKEQYHPARRPQLSSMRESKNGMAKSKSKSKSESKSSQTRSSHKPEIIKKNNNRMKKREDKKIFDQFIVQPTEWKKKKCYFTFMTVKWIIIRMPLPADTQVFIFFIINFFFFLLNAHKYARLMYCWSLTKRHREKASIERKMDFVFGYNKKKKEKKEKLLGP